MGSWVKFLLGDDDELPEGSQAPADETDNTGCQHANWKTNGMSTWCEDCGLSDDA
ncbi:MAG: hypothetical protein ACRDNW_18230 [Trebonia sp.]